jgi:hypothetical protein
MAVCEAEHPAAIRCDRRKSLPLVLKRSNMSMGKAVIIFLMHKGLA